MCTTTSKSYTDQTGKSNICNDSQFEYTYYNYEALQRYEEIAIIISARRLYFNRFFKEIDNINQTLVQSLGTCLINFIRQAELKMKFTYNNIR